ncbi:MAG: hypothetical protein DRJ45_01465 [Thermoprotei archaeon]|nr:MAG: hypothetical protein DRJ45_01465 [Thermoprotei archaeon]
MDIVKDIVETAGLVNQYLEKVFMKEKKNIPSNGMALKLFEMAYDYTMRGGKRLRPIAMIKLYYFVKKRIDENIIAPALGVEFLQNSSICHDDIMDEDVLRRGKPTVQVMSAEIFLKKILLKKYSDPSFWMGKESLYKIMDDYKNIYRNGISYAILAGNLLFSFAFKTVAESNMDLNKKIYVIQKLLELYIRLNYGQAIDIEQESRYDVTINDYLNMIDAKTGALFYIPMEMAAVLSDLPNSDVFKIKEWARLIFQAFQIRDDILGTFGREEKTGKPIDSDIKEGKRTLLVIHSLKNLDENERKIFLNILGNRLATSEQIDIVRKFMMKTGALKCAEEMSRKLYLKSLEHLEQTNIPSEAKDFFKKFSEYIITRRK